MALSYDTNWNNDTCHYLDYPVPLTYSPPEPSLIDTYTTFEEDEGYYNNLNLSPSLDTCPALEFKPYCDQQQYQYCPYLDSIPYSSVPIQEIRLPEFSIGIGGGGKSSVAARQRRRRITEKTGELGKLVPGGHKMNTAEMFGAAFKYIKYLQAQVGILHSIQEIEAEQISQNNEELHELATSKKVQEKMYSHEKCLVPKKFIESIQNDLELEESNPVLLKEIHQLMQRSG